MLIEGGHEVAGADISHGPERDQHVARARCPECAHQAVDAVAVVDHALRGLARREHHELGALEVDALGLDGIENAVVAILFQRGVGPGETDAGEQHRAVKRAFWCAIEAVSSEVEDPRRGGQCLEPLFGRAGTVPDRISALNDTFRRTLAGGKVVMTAGIASLSHDEREEVIKAVGTLEAFDRDDDPYGEHDFGALEVRGRRIFWKTTPRWQVEARTRPTPPKPRAF